MSNLMYPSMQKFYSALKSIESFSIENSFFDNISSLDAFFSEFRNVTFALQKSLKHTEYMVLYEELRTKYLNDSKWFIDKRNETIKQQPFQLVKEITITVYFPGDSLKVSSVNFTVDNDVPISNHIDQFKTMFAEINPYEVFFSAEFKFYENGDNIDIYSEIEKGVGKMKSFIDEMLNRIEDDCPLCDEIEKKINRFKVNLFPRDMFLVTDYLYYPDREIFHRAERLAGVVGMTSKTGRNLLSVFQSGPLSKIGGSIFTKFILMHVMIGTTDLMPTFMIIYDDNTFELDTFHSSIKTTMYRKINEVSIKVIKGGVRQVLLMAPYIVIESSQNNIPLTSKGRSELAKNEVLAFMSVDCNSIEEEVYFEDDKIKCESYIFDKMKSVKNSKLELGKTNMAPIIGAFKVKNA